MSKTTKWLVGGVAVVAIAGIAYASFGPQTKSKDQETLTVGIMAGDKRTDEQWKIIKNNAKKEGLTLKIKTLTDYTQPNAALTSGDIDTNAF